MGPMQALERVWDRPAVRWPLALISGLVLLPVGRVGVICSHCRERFLSPAKEQLERIYL